MGITVGRGARLEVSRVGAAVRALSLAGFGDGLRERCRRGFWLVRCVSDGVVRCGTAVGTQPEVPDAVSERDSATESACCAELVSVTAGARRDRPEAVAVIRATIPAVSRKVRNRLVMVVAVNNLIQGTILPEPMVIDFHTHIFPDELAPRALDSMRACTSTSRFGADGTLAGLLESMDHAGIDRSITLPVASRPDQLSTINAYATSLDTSRIVAFGALHPTADTLEACVRGLVAAGVRGVKLHPEYQDFHVDDPSNDPMYDLLSEAGLITVFHAGWDPAPFTRDRSHPAALRRVLDRFPRLRMVAAHMGGYRMWDEAERWLVGTRAYLDTAATLSELEPAAFVRMVRAHGADRVLFASDSPWFRQDTFLSALERSGLPDRDIERIRGDNAAELLGD